MSAAVETHQRKAALEPLVNGHTVVNGSAPVKEDARRWEDRFLPPPLRLDDKIRAQKVEARLSGLVLDGATLRRVAQVFEEEIERGLRQQPSSLQMENTYVPELPDGTEEGVFLALDLGGTNFRVLLLELRGGKLLREDVKHYNISDAMRLGPGVDLFNFLADCVEDFVRSEGMENEKFSLGFTFSFPMKQHSISSGELITWTKSFKCGGLEGVDVAALLQRCLRARHLDVTVRVLLNDTTGTLVAGAHIRPDVGIGVILGTGSNGCYMERASRVHWEAAHARAQDVCVDIEWGAFGDNGCLDFIRTEFDRDVDDNSLLATSFTFEKYIGGKFLGEVVSSALRALARGGLLPAAPPHAALHAAHLSLIEESGELFGRGVAHAGGDAGDVRRGRGRGRVRGRGRGRGRVGRRRRARHAARRAGRLQPRRATRLRLHIDATAAHGPPVRGGGGGRLRVQAAPAHRAPHGQVHRAARPRPPVHAARRGGRQRQGLRADGRHRRADRYARPLVAT